MTSYALSEKQLTALADFLSQAEDRLAEEELAAERSQAAYGENSVTDLQIIAPVGAGK